jgi:hypothetical protein
MRSARLLRGQTYFQLVIPPRFLLLIRLSVLLSLQPAFDWQPAVPGDFAGTGACFSDQEVIVLNEVPCTDANAILIYYFDQGPAPSLLPRRKRDILRQLAAARDVSICPQGLTACRVENSDNGFEVRHRSP